MEEESIEETESGGAIASLKKAGFVVLGIILAPLGLAIYIIPRRLYKPLLFLIVVVLGYRWIYPRQNPLTGFRDLSIIFLGWLSAVVNVGKPLWSWLDNETNATFLASMVALVGLVITEISRRAEKHRQREQDIAKITPRMTVRFEASGDGDVVCTILNLGAGTALAVRFSLLVIANPSPHHQYAEDVWRPLKTEKFNYILPEARDPKAVLISSLKGSTTREVMVRIEYEDTLDRSHYSFAYGGHSTDGAYMEVGDWRTTTKVRGAPRSLWSRLAGYLFLQSERGLAMVGDLFRRYLPIQETDKSDWTKGRQAVVDPAAKEEKAVDRELD